MGDSITDNWVRGDQALFADGIVGRGIGGQTSLQMLARFRQDVVALRPRVVDLFQLVPRLVQHRLGLAVCTGRVSKNGINIRAN